MLTDMMEVVFLKNYLTWKSTTQRHYLEINIR